MALTVTRPKRKRPVVARAKVSQLENVHLEAARTHANAESTLTNRTTERNHIVWAIENTSGLRTRSEIADNEKQIAKAQTLIDKAVVAENEALTLLRYAVSDVEDARAAYNAAEIAARECDAELKRLLSQKADYSQAGLPG
jgi:hypothetical protein